MNAPVKQTIFAEPPTEADAPFAFELARGRLLDAFFELEVAVSQWLRRLGEKDGGKSLGQRLDLLARHPLLCEQATAKQVRQIQSLAETFAEPLRIRNAAVHSRREWGTRSGEPCILLATIDHAVDEDRCRFVVTLTEMDAAAKQARNFAGWLSNYLQQSSRAQR